MVRSYGRSGQTGLEISEFEPLSEYTDYDESEGTSSPRRTRRMSSRKLKIASGVMAVLLATAIVLGILYARNGNSNDNESRNSIGDQLNLKDNDRNHTIVWSMINPTTSPSTRATENASSRSSRLPTLAVANETTPTTTVTTTKSTSTTTASASSSPATTTVVSTTSVPLTTSIATETTETTTPSTTESTSASTSSAASPSTTTPVGKTNATLIATETTTNSTVAARTTTPSTTESTTASTASASSPSTTTTPISTTLAAVTTTSKEPSTSLQTPTTTADSSTPESATTESFKPTTAPTTPRPLYPEPVTKPEVGQWYVIMSYTDGRVLDVYQGSSVTANQIGLWPFNLHDNQHFRFNKAPSQNTSYTIEGRRSGKQVIYRTSRGFYKGHRSPIQLYDATFSSNEIWIINQRENQTGLVQIENATAKKCLRPNTIKNRDSHDILTAMDCSDGDDEQLWRIVPICE